MAWYEIVYECGHSGRTQLCGSHKERERRIEYLRTCLCPECNEAEKSARIKQRMNDDEKAGLAPLTGSNKQIAWAQELRASFIEKCTQAREDIDRQKNIYSKSHTAEETEAEYNLAVKVLALAEEQTLSHISSHWWIDNRYNCFQNAINVAERAVKECASENTPAAVDAIAEATVRPENQTKLVIPEILVQDNKVLVRAPKDEDLRLLVRGLGYRFSDGCWQKEITSFTGGAEDRAAEVGNALLLLGFSVIIHDESIRRKAIEADFMPECKKWIAIRTTGKYIGWLCISFPRERQDLYDAARKITGSRWDSPNVIIPIEYCAQVEDFADALGFQITPKAQSTISAYQKSIREASPIASLEPQPETNKLADILNSSTDIIPDLSDD